MIFLKHGFFIWLEPLPSSLHVYHVHHLYGSSTSFAWRLKLHHAALFRPVIFSCRLPSVRRYTCTCKLLLLQELCHFLVFVKFFTLHNCLWEKEAHDYFIMPVHCAGLQRGSFHATSHRDRAERGRGKLAGCEGKCLYPSWSQRFQPLFSRQELYRCNQMWSRFMIWTLLRWPLL